MSDPAVPVPRLHVLVAAVESGRRDDLRAMAELGGGRLALQLRAPSLDGRRLFEAACELVGLTRGTGVTVVVNDRVDVAMAAGAHGVHLKELSIDPPSARRVSGKGLLIGRSVHGAAAAREIGRWPLDYLVLGSVYATASHPDGTPLPLHEPEEAVAGSSIPVVGVGGVTPSRLMDLRRRGLHGAVVYSGVWSAERPSDALSSYLEVLSGEDS